MIKVDFSVIRSRLALYFNVKGKIIRVDNWQEICNYLTKSYVFSVSNVLI